MSDFTPNNITDQPQPLQAAPYLPPASSRNIQDLFKGRLNRLGYILGSVYCSLLIMIPIAISIIATVIGSSQKNVLAGIIAVVFFILTFVAAIVISFASISFTVRRLHDFNQSGLLALLLLVPGANYIFVIVMAAIPGTPGPNKFGVGPQPTLGLRDITGLNK